MTVLLQLYIGVPVYLGNFSMAKYLSDWV